MEDVVTRIDNFGDWSAKREDLACFTNLDNPSGSKVRQYLRMAKSNPGVPMIVGCSADSCMQIYVASSAKLTGVDGIIYTAKRKERSEATRYAEEMGSEIVEVKPAYLNIVRKRASERSKEIGKVVKWNVSDALHDTIMQCSNIDSHCKRIVIPTGSGLTAIGVLVGLSKINILGRFEFKPKVFSIAVSTMAKKEEILSRAAQIVRDITLLPDFELVYSPYKYQHPVIACLPDDTPLDPFYAAKAMPYIMPGDCLWIPGLRPVISMPLKCQIAFQGWSGPSLIK